MSPEEQQCRRVAVAYRNFARATKSAHLLHFSIRSARSWDEMADVAALDGLDLRDLFAPTAGDALALRGTSPEGA